MTEVVILLATIPAAVLIGTVVGYKIASIIKDGHYTSEMKMQKEIHEYERNVR